MYKNYKCIVLFFLIFICHYTNAEHKTTYTEKVTDTLFCSNDTIVICNKINNTACKLSWGVTGRFMHTSSDTLPLTHYSFNEYYKKANFFIIRDGCGTGCSYLYLLHFNIKKKAKMYLQPLLVAIDKNIIIYQGDNPKYLLTINNILFNKEISIDEHFDLKARPYSSAVDSLKLNDTNLIIYWTGSDEKKRVKTYNINYLLQLRNMPND